MNAKLHEVVHARWFQRTIIGVILLAGLLAGLETSAEMRERYGTWLFALDTLVLVIFIAEIGLKMAAHGRQPWQYFRDGWNVFDFTIVALCCLPMDTQFAAVLRLARALRLLRLVTALPRLQLMVGALLKSLGAMGYVGLLLALLFYIYGVAGVHLFGNLEPTYFGSLPRSMLTLFRVVTLEGWTSVMYPLLYDASAAAPGQAAPLLSRTAPWTVPAYFISFILFGTMIMLNLFIGIIMNSMSEMHAEMAERDRQQHERQTGHPTLADEVILLEKQIEALRQQTMTLKHALARQPQDSAGAGPLRLE